MPVKFCIAIPSCCRKQMQKISGRYFFAAPCIAQNWQRCYCYHSSLLSGRLQPSYDRPPTVKNCFEHSLTIQNRMDVTLSRTALHARVLCGQRSGSLQAYTHHAILELCAAAAAPPPPTECRRRAGAVYVKCSRHVVHQLYVALDFCNAVYNESSTLTKSSKNDAGVFCNSP